MPIGADIGESVRHARWLMHVQTSPPSLSEVGSCCGTCCERMQVVAHARGGAAGAVAACGQERVLMAQTHCSGTSPSWKAGALSRSHVIASHVVTLIGDRRYERAGRGKEEPAGHRRSELVGERLP